MAFIRVVSSKEIMNHPYLSLSAVHFMPAAEKAAKQRKLISLQKSLDKLHSQLRNTEQRVAELDKILEGDSKIGGP
jgi:sulfur transfer protein SufE